MVKVSQSKQGKKSFQYERGPSKNYNFWGNLSKNHLCAKNQQKLMRKKLRYIDLHLSILLHRLFTRRLKAGSAGLSEEEKNC